MIYFTDTKVSTGSALKTTRQADRMGGIVHALIVVHH